MIITGNSLSELVTGTDLITQSSALVGSASIDLCLGEFLLVPEEDQESISLTDSGQFHRVKIPPKGYRLNPFDTVLGHSAEVLKLPPDVAGLVSLRSSAARMGLNHLMAAFVHPGFSGSLTFELHNTRRTTIVLKPHDRLLQLILLRTTDNTEYSGVYFNIGGVLGPK